MHTSAVVLKMDAQKLHKTLRSEHLWNVVKVSNAFG